MLFLWLFLFLVPVATQPCAEVLVAYRFSGAREDNCNWWKNHMDEVIGSSAPRDQYVAILDRGRRLVYGHTEDDVFNQLSEADALQAHVVCLRLRRALTNQERLDQIVSVGETEADEADYAGVLALTDLKWVNVDNDAEWAWTWCYHDEEAKATNPTTFQPVSGLCGDPGRMFSTLLISSDIKQLHVVATFLIDTGSLFTMLQPELFEILQLGSPAKAAIAGTSMKVFAVNGARYDGLNILGLDFLRQQGTCFGLDGRRFNRTNWLPFGRMYFTKHNKSQAPYRTVPTSPEAGVTAISRLQATASQPAASHPDEQTSLDEL